MSANTAAKSRVYLDLTHLGRHVTGIERVSIEQFEKAQFEAADIIALRSTGVLSMIVRQQLWLPLLAVLHPSAQFAFPGFPPSPFFALIPNRVLMYVHDTFLLTRKGDLSIKARLYMAPQFALAVRRLTRFLVNSEKTRGDLKGFARADASIDLYRPAAANHFDLDSAPRLNRPDLATPLKLVCLGTVEPRKNYGAALAILDKIRKTYDANAELHIIGRAGWGNDADLISMHDGVTVHGYLPAGGVRKVLEDADIYLCTSHDEGLGLPLLEAQFAGLPVVAPDQAVFREVLGSSGTFIDPSQPAAAAATIQNLVSSPGWRKTELAAAVANVQRWQQLAAADFASARTVFNRRASTKAASAKSILSTP